MADHVTAELDFARRAWEQAATWYRNADTKAQIILTLTGTLIGFVSALVFGTDTDEVIASFTATTWISIAVFGIAAVLALLFAALVLVPRTAVTMAGKRRTSSEGHTPLHLWRFDLIAEQSEEKYVSLTGQVDVPEETAALAVHTHQLASAGIDKHRLVALGFLFLAVAVLALGVGAASFVVAA